MRKLTILFSIFCLLLMTFIGCEKDSSEGQTAQQQQSTPPVQVKPSKVKAIISMVMGKAYMSKNNAQTELKRGTDVSDADFLQTTKASRCTVLFSTGSTLSLQDATKIKISLLLPKGVKSEMEKGTALLNINKLTSNEEFSLTTPTAVVGVRGTKFYVNYDSRTASTRVAVSQGKIQVTPVIDVNTNEETKEKIKAKLSINIEANESLNVNKAQITQINRTLQANIKTIEQAVTNNTFETTQPVVVSENVIKRQKAAVSLVDKQILNKIPERIQAAEQNKIFVVINIEDAKITVNDKSENGAYFGYHDPGSKITVKVEKTGFKPFTMEYDLPQTERFSPEIKLERDESSQSTPEQTQQTQIIPTPVQPTTRVVMERKDLPRIALEFAVGTTAQSPLFTAGGKVFFLGADGKFYIVDMNNAGSIVNTIPINSIIQSTPIVHAGIVYFGAMNNNLYAVNLITGALLFTKQIAAGPFTLKNSVVPFGNSIYFAINGQVHKLNRITGNIEWQKKLNSNTWGCVGVDAKHVYVPDELGNMIALKVTDGTEVWKNKISSSRFTLSKAFVIGDKVLINNQAGELISVKIENGEANVTNLRVGNLAEAPYQYGNLIYYPTANGIIVVNARVPSIIANINTGGAPKFAIQGANLFVNGPENKIKQTNLVGAPAWDISLNGEASNYPAADNLYVYVLTSKNTLYKLNLRDHEMIRKVVPR